MRRKCQSIGCYLVNKKCKQNFVKIFRFVTDNVKGHAGKTARRELMDMLMEFYKQTRAPGV